MKWKILCIILLVFSVSETWSQYTFSGHIDVDIQQGDIYLSVVEDYRKISGVHPEQIIAKTTADSTGFFKFSGNNLPSENRIYRIHVDECDEDSRDVNHFMGHCPNSKEVIFVANNNTELFLPSTFENEIFCEVVSENEKSKAFLKIDSLKHDMRYAFGAYRSEANRKLNSKKWFSILQQYGEQLQEPLAELYSYAFLSDRSSDLYEYYLEDLKNSAYYDELLQRLKNQYPDSPYTQQYESELKSDRYLIEASNSSMLPWWAYLLSGVCILSLLGNYYFFGKLRGLQKSRATTGNLSRQEEKVLQHILDDKTNKEIAEAMYVSVSTIKTHINNIYRKLNVSSRDEAKSLYRG